MGMGRTPHTEGHMGCQRRGKLLIRLSQLVRYYRVSDPMGHNEDRESSAHDKHRSVRPDDDLVGQVIE
jgi:hypothetical protein